MKAIYIMYDKGYKKVNLKDFPITFKTLKSLDLTINTGDNKKGLLTEDVLIPTKMNGKKITLTKLYLSKINYDNCIKEIDAGEEPVLMIKANKVAFMLKCKM